MLLLCHPAALLAMMLCCYSCYADVHAMLYPKPPHTIPMPTGSLWCAHHMCSCLYNVQFLTGPCAYAYCTCCWPRLALLTPGVSVMLTHALCRLKLIQSLDHCLSVMLWYALCLSYLIYLINYMLVANYWLIPLLNEWITSYCCHSCMLMMLIHLCVLLLFSIAHWTWSSD
jgi:hypothetical protein